ELPVRRDGVDDFHNMSWRQSAADDIPPPPLPECGGRFLAEFLSYHGCGPYRKQKPADVKY
ncbi:MAG TPA: hypothetical protein VIU41_09055, partial [Geobacteraceae bacterium]